MSAHLMSLHRCCQRSALLLVARRPWSSSSASPPPLHTRLLLFLTQRFYDMEMLLSWSSQLKRRVIKRKNAYYSYAQRFHGSDIAAAYYVLNLKGGFRFVGLSAWFRANHRGKFNWDFLNHKDTPLEEVDMSYSVINYTGLVNLEGQRSLRTLSFRGCPEVDDWFLAKLHMFQDSLEELDISHCPRITTGGLAALRNLKGLRRLDISSLPGISSPGLIIILLEEMLPQCQITASGYNLSLSPEEKMEQMQEQRDELWEMSAQWAFSRGCLCCAKRNKAAEDSLVRHVNINTEMSLAFRRVGSAPCRRPDVTSIPPRRSHGFSTSTPVLATTPSTRPLARTESSRSFPAQFSHGLTWTLSGVFYGGG